MTNFDMRGQQVLNQYNAETINILVTQSDRFSRIQWRKLATVNYAIREDSERFQNWFASDIFKSLNEIFSTTGYKHFTALFHPQPVNRDGQGFFVYAFHCHQIRFAAEVKRRGMERILLIEKLRGQAADEQMKTITALDDEDKIFFAQWHGHGSIDFTRPGVLQIEYDPDGKTMSIKSQKDFSLDPLEYEHHVETTSELLSYIGAAQSTVFGFLGDIDSVTKNWPLLKLTTCILDREPIDIDAIRINSNDYEQWDYRNTKLEAELATYRR
jgi:hypothetical protein